jgi:hypothetical protein
MDCTSLLFPSSHTFESLFVLVDLMALAFTRAAIVVNGEFGDACVAVISERPAIVSILR